MNFKNIFSLNYKQIASLVVFIIGVCLVLYSMHEMDSFREAVTMKVTGKYSKEIMWNLFGGIVMVILGGSGAVIFRNWHKKK